MTTPWIILGEGQGDDAFFKHLLETRAIENVEVRNRPKHIHGNTVFGQWLEMLKAETGLQDRSGILIVADNDSDPEKSFNLIKSQIEQAGEYGVPSEPRVPASSSNERPPIMVLMLPWDEELGCLETLCLKAAFKKHRKIAKCVRRFVECVAAENWESSKLSKLRMRCFLSAACKNDPNTGLQYAWSEGRPPDLIPLLDKCFDAIAKFLAELP